MGVVVFHKFSFRGYFIVRLLDAKLLGDVIYGGKNGNAILLENPIFGSDGARHI